MKLRTDPIFQFAPTWKKSQTTRASLLSSLDVLQKMQQHVVHCCTISWQLVVLQTATIYLHVIGTAESFTFDQPAMPAKLMPRQTCTFNTPMGSRVQAARLSMRSSLVISMHLKLGRTTLENNQSLEGPRKCYKKSKIQFRG